MAVKKNEEIAPASAEPVAVVEAAPRRGISGVGIAAIVVGGVIAAGALFGGGVLVGSHLPSSGYAEAVPNFPGLGPDLDDDRPDLQGQNRPNFPGGGPGPVMPDQHGTAPDRDGDNS